eukprot:TRINITY_DN10229_c0_g1_i1.p1 TRINITY_DN10229_c0_g1~~TRINITY_DN10229_c0_g1_i1.p1  ORF type:complete len:582 (+),score=215.08 TRINITY_DN10229_c0_g1_i1:72-1748(+)
MSWKGGKGKGGGWRGRYDDRREFRDRGDRPQPQHERPVYNVGVISDSRSDATVSSLADVLKLVLEKYSRYQNELLNLADLRSIEELKKHDPRLDRKLWAEVVARCIKQITDKPGQMVRGITLDNNHITDLTHLSNAFQDAGLQLDSISLRDNNIRDIQVISMLRSLRLRHLILAGNPIYEADEKKLMRALKKALPSLDCIDSRIIERNTALDQLRPVQKGFSEQVEFHRPVLAFVQQYFGVCQGFAAGTTNVEGLLGCYVPANAMATITVAKGFKLGTTPEAEDYCKALVMASHNVHQQPYKEAYRCCNQGRLSIGSMLQKLHGMHFDVDPQDILKNTDLTMFDPGALAQVGFPLQALMTVSMHYAVTYSVKDSRDDTETRVRRYCDRTWSLTAQVQQGGQTQIFIINDFIHLREPMREKSAVLVATAPVQGAKVFYSLHLYQEDVKVVELAAASGLFPEIARLCLEETDAGPWDLEKAAQLFQKRKASGALQPQHFAGVTDKAQIACRVFSERTRLTMDAAHMCLSLPSVQFDMWKGWLLFLESQKSGALNASHYQQ